MEQEKVKTLSPFERLDLRFSEMPENSGDHFIGSRNKKLADGTDIRICHISSFSGGLRTKSVLVNIEPKDSANPNFRFNIDGKGQLDWIEIPNFTIAVGATTLFSGRIAPLSIINVKDSDGKKAEMAEDLVNWLDFVFEKDRYIKPPITASVFK